MMAQSSREGREAEGGPLPACHDSPNGGACEAWQERPAAVYPPGYPRLCTDDACFGGLVDEWDGCYAPEFDHTEVTDVLVRSANSSGNRRYHLPEGHEGVQG